MRLKPLEFSACASDSPVFRATIKAHEQATDYVSSGIKQLQKQYRTVNETAHEYSKSEQTFAETLINFRFDDSETSEEFAGTATNTEDELMIEGSFHTFGDLLMEVETLRGFLLDTGMDRIDGRLQEFRKRDIVAVRDAKKKFDRESEKYYQVMEKSMAVSAKKKESALNDADAEVEKARQEMQRASMAYVRELNGLEAKKRFEFVEQILVYLYQYKTFLHSAFERFLELEPMLMSLSERLSNARGTFEAGQELVAELMEKTEAKATARAQQASTIIEMDDVQEGHLCLREKRKGVGHNWVRHYGRYSRESKELSLFTIGQGHTPSESYTVTGCRMQDASSDRRFVFDVLCQDSKTLTCQAPGATDYDEWVCAMTGGETVPSRDLKARPVTVKKKKKASSIAKRASRKIKKSTLLNHEAKHFITACIEEIERRGLDEEGLYRLPGSLLRTNDLLARGMANKPLRFAEEETKTLCSALKSYFRKMENPLMTFELQDELLEIAKRERMADRVTGLTRVMCRLPRESYLLLKELMHHLKRVSDESAVNRMQASNLGVCFGPTLMRSQVESMEAISNIKYQNLIVELLIVNVDEIFASDPDYTVEAENIYELSPSEDEDDIDDDDDDYEEVIPASQRPPASAVAASAPMPDSVMVAAAAALQTSPTAPPLPARNTNQSTPAVAAAAAASLSTTPSMSSLGSGSAQNSGDGKFSETAKAPPQMAPIKPKPRPGAPPSNTLAAGGSSGSGPQPMPRPAAKPSVPTPTTSSQAVFAPSTKKPLLPPSSTSRPSSSGPPPTLPKDKPQPAAPAPSPQTSSGAPSPRRPPPLPKKEKDAAVPLAGNGGSAPSPASAGAAPHPGRPAPRPVPKKRPSTSVSTTPPGTPSTPTPASSASAILPPSARPHVAVPAKSAVLPRPPTAAVAPRPVKPKPSAPSVGKRARALFPCEPDDPEELRFKAGDLLVDITQSSEPGWLRGRVDCTDQFGLFPDNYVDML